MADSSEAHMTENIDQAIIEQVRDIEKEASCLPEYERDLGLASISDAFPLVGEPEGIEVLGKDYADDDEVYQAKLKDLYSRYNRIRKTRGDGNCFYRSYGFGILELCLNDTQLLDKVCEKAGSIKNSLIELGYPAYTVEDFHETFSEVFDVARKGQSLDEIVQLYNDQGYSDYLVVFLRLMVSCYLQQNEDFYSAFLETYTTMKDFCSQEVEPMAKESDHIHIIALSNVLNTTIQVEYMDRGGLENTCNHHCFPDDGSQPIIYLLYRPGHYDLLYTKTENVNEAL